MFDKVRHGDFPGCPPVGYRNGTSRYEPAIIVDQTLGPLVRESFELAATGNHSLRELLKIMTEKGLVSRTGNCLGVSSLWRMLTNPFYTGRIRYFDELVPGNHEALVDDDLFMEVLESVKRRRKI